MANRRRVRRLKGVAVYLPRILYDAWLDSLTAKELAMAMLPPSQEEILGILPGDRKDYDIVYMQMPKWWTEWYRSLSMEEKFIFGKLIEKRLRSIGLIGGVL